jgi:hypothetical protein
MNGRATHSPAARCHTPVGAWGQLGTPANGPTWASTHFSTFHTPYCSLFL